MKFPQSERQGALFPLLLLAAVGVIVLSAVSTAAIVGWLPAAHSVASVVDENAPPARVGSSPAVCVECATRTFDEDFARWKPGDRVSVTDGRLSAAPASQ